jgi:hypothetical protein
MQPGSPFKRYLERNRKELGKRLLEKAYIANRLAKLSSGRQRTKLYNLKYKYVVSAMRLLPETFRVDPGVGEDFDRRPVLGIRTRVGFSFHIPATEIPDQVQVLLDAERGGLIEQKIA